MVVEKEETVSNYKEEIEKEAQKVEEPVSNQIVGKRVSALSLSSIRAKKELQASIQKKVVNLDDLPKEPFTEEALMKEWKIYGERLSSSGLMLMCSLMGMVEPKVHGSKVHIELPNEGSKLSFDENKYDLVNYLRKKLDNYDIEVLIQVNEEITIKQTFDPREKLKHLNELNPNLELLCRTFALELKH